MKYIRNFLYIIFILYINKISCNNVKKIVVKGSNDSSEDGIKRSKNTFDRLKARCEKMDNEEMIKCLMNTYLNVFDININGFCEPDDDYCISSVRLYSDRCASDPNNCHLLDKYNLVNLSGGDIYVPNLIQAEIAKYIFIKSGAYANIEMPSCICAGECNCDCDCKTLECEYKRDVMSFLKTIVAHNMYQMGVEGSSDIDLLRKFVYMSCLYYNAFYIYPEDNENNTCNCNKNLQSIFRYYKSYTTRRKFSKMRRYSKMHIYIPYNEIQILFDNLVIYLSEKPLIKYKHMAISFVKVFRHTLIKSVPVYKHSYLFSYYLKKNKIDINNLCDQYSPNGRELVTQFLKRCEEEGECYIFHDYKLYPDDSPINFIVPQLSEVNIVYYLLKNISYKYGKINSALTNNTRPYAEIQYMAPRLLKVNRRKFEHIEDDTIRIIQAYLYYASIYFVRTYRELWITRQIRHIANWNVKPKLKAMLCDEAKGTNLDIDITEIKKIFPAYRKYLSNSYFKNHPNRVNRYSQIVEDVLMSYYNEEVSSSCKCKTSCQQNEVEYNIINSDDKKEY